VDDAGIADDAALTAISADAAHAAEVAEHAAAAAEVAEPHPLVPSPHDPLRPAFQLYAEIDLPVLGVGLVFAASRLVRSQKAYCAPLCDRGELNQLDRQTAGYWNTDWRLTSNLAVLALAGGVATWLFVDEGFLNALNDAVVIAESALAAMATVSIMTLAINRPRPFLYGEDAPLAQRNGPDASLSFLSSHATVAFAAATASLMTARRLYPKSKLPLLVGGAAGALAALVAITRVLAGMHFVTDALGGAIVGMSMGVLIPALHGTPTRLLPSVSHQHSGLSLVTRF
jgi:membrane-associated phospholipid phosphatase